MHELLTFREVQAVKRKGFKLPLAKELYTGLIDEMRQMIQEFIDSGKLDNCRIEEQNNEIFLIEDIIVEDLDKKVGEISYHYIHDFDHLIKLEEIRYNYICDLFEEENKEMLEDESLDIVDDDWFEFVSLANIEGIGSITLKELGINLERFTTEKL